VRAAARRALGDEREVDEAVVVGEEHRLAAVAALGYMLGDTGKDETREPGHAVRRSAAN
jgi:hypothetical protein